MSEAQQLLGRLRQALGQAQVLAGDKATRRFCRGYRFGQGAVLAVVRPGTLLQYPAKPALAGFYRTLDPSNTFNPGIGRTSRLPGWGGEGGGH